MTKKRDLRIHDRRTLQNRVSHILREAILRGDLEQGEHLVQDELAKELGVSRMPIREALRQLESEGMIVFEPYRGAVVKLLTIKEIDEIYTLRATLESIAMKKSVPKLSNNDLKQMEKLLIEMEQSVEDANVFIEANIEFHRLLYLGTDWDRLKSFIRMLCHGIPNYTPFVLNGQIEISNQEHRQIFETIQKRDAYQASLYITEHIRRTGEHLKEYMQRERFPTT